MASYSRLLLQFTAIAGIAAMTWIAAPAVAAESVVPGSEAAVATEKVAPSMIKHRAWRRSWVAASHHRDRRDHRVSQIPSNLDCSGVWCGRQFVLMLGIGY